MHGRVPFALPGIRVSLRAVKPELLALQGDSLGRRLKRRRKELGLYLKEAAVRMGVQDFTLIKWEQDAAEPYVTYYPAIIAFLGYEPWPEPRTLGERIRAARYRKGLSFREAAVRYDIDDGTLLKSEHGRVRPTIETLRKLAGLMAQ